MITETDIKQIESIKQVLNFELNKDFNWETVNQIECLDRLIKNLRIAPLSFKFSSPESNFYTSECDKCGWWGSSELLDGGSQIGDSGDYSDCYCPVCGNLDLYDKEPINFKNMTELKTEHLVYMSDEMYTPIHYKGMVVEQPFFQSNGNHSVTQLEALCEQFKDYVHQQQIIKENCMKHIVELKFGIKFPQNDD